MNKTVYVKAQFAPVGKMQNVDVPTGKKRARFLVVRKRSLALRGNGLKPGLQNQKLTPSDFPKTSTPPFNH